ncbi:MAG: hypothetical protein IT454_15190 [Planctomycetes bacterium]|nr:hypothetical protein [Planctomycetota bacterium]
MKYAIAMVLTLSSLGACSRAPQSETLVEVESELEANKLVCALDLCHVAGAHKVLEQRDDKPLWRVTVPEGQLARAERVRQAFGLPQVLTPLDATVTSDGQFLGMQSPETERQKAQWRDALRLEDTLRMNPAIFTARVHLALPSIGLTGERLKDVEPSASVFVRYVELPGAQAELPQLSAEKLRAQIAGGVAGLTAEHVVVTLCIIRPSEVFGEWMTKPVPDAAETERNATAVARPEPSQPESATTEAPPAGLSPEPWITGGLATVAAALLVALWARRRGARANTAVSGAAAQS